MIDFTILNISNATTVVQIRGQLNESTRSYFFDCISDLFDEHVKNVIIECNGLGTLSSAGLASLLTARNRAETHGGKIYLTHLNSTISSLLELTKLSQLLAVYPTTKELIAKLESADATNDSEKLAV